MPEERRKKKRELALQLKEALIQAALTLIAEQGIRGATVRTISERANVTQGLIRYYFTSKEELIIAAYAHHMTCMIELTFASTKQVIGAARARFVAFVDAALKPPVVNPRSIALWASFLNKVRQDEQMKLIHERIYSDFRDLLEELIRAVLDEAGKQTDGKRLRRSATACNAVIDGLWLDGGALPNAFAPGELPGTGLESVGATIGITLEQGAGKP